MDPAIFRRFPFLHGFYVKGMFLNLVFRVETGDVHTGVSTLLENLRVKTVEYSSKIGGEFPVW